MGGDHILIQAGHKDFICRFSFLLTPKHPSGCSQQPMISASATGTGSASNGDGSEMAMAASRSNEGRFWGAQTRHCPSCPQHEHPQRGEWQLLGAQLRLASQPLKNLSIKISFCVYL